MQEANLEEETAVEMHRKAENKAEHRGKVGDILKLCQALGSDSDLRAELLP